MDDFKNLFDDEADVPTPTDDTPAEYFEEDFSDELTEEDLEEYEQDHQPRATFVPRTRLTFYAIILILASVFLFCGVFLGKYYSKAQDTTNDYDQLASIYNQATEDVTDPTRPSFDPTDPVETQPPEMLPNMKEVYALNNDLVGWISLPRLNIDYPVMQTPHSRDYYLYRDFFKNDNNTGCLYVRENCDVFKPSDNVVIYGHAMKTGDMFGRLFNFRNYSFWEKNQYFTFDTLYERHTYQIFSVFITSGTQYDNSGNHVGYPYHRLNDFPSAAAFDQFIADIKGAAFTGTDPYVGRCLFETGITPQFGDKLVCLSTCEYTLNDGRLVIMGVQVD